MGMGMLSMDSLPLGYRFRPTDEELISHYLRHKINGHHSQVQVISEVDVCKWEPWDLPDLSVIKTDDPEWFFFCPWDRKYPNGHHFNRATEAGYWKATGKDRTIKSRKSSLSGRSNIHLIGIKKTLVFYRGRAPKGERTNWIMHEYRATEPDLDGNGPGQAHFVLCRLFRKPDEKPDSSKYDEVERTGSSPAAIKSSPDDTYSDRFQEPALPNTEIKAQSEGIKRWLIDNSDNIIPNNLVPFESCITEVGDHSTEDMPAEVYPPQGGDPMSHNSPLQPHNYLGEFSMDSPYADDFGNHHHDFHFQDGAEEQDVYLAELFEVLRNHDKYPCKVSENLMRLTSERESLMNDNQPLRGQSAQDLVSFPYPEPIMGDTGIPSDYSVGEDTPPAHSIVTSFCDQERPNASQSGNHVAGSGIKIKARQSQNKLSSQNLTMQGTAARRIRLQTGPVPMPNKVKEGCEHSLPNDEPEVTSILRDSLETAFKRSKRPRWGKVSGKIDSTKMGSSINSMAFSSVGGLRFSKIYALSICFILILSMIFIGMYRCPNFLGAA